MSSPSWFDSLQKGAITFSPVRREHQEYIFSLRTNPIYNRHLSAPPASAAKQGDWIDGYVTREERGEEFYFLITRTDDGCPCGTVRLYDFQGTSFCWGSWILDQNKPRLAAVESALLVYEIAFEKLKFLESHFDVRVDNTRVIKFHERMGAVRTEILADDQHMRLTKAAFEAEKCNLLRIIAGNG
ncbi:GNAT family N-acetyltransferase [Rhizobium metallidurans]|uniref:RimJ/RimL family protein N-acetyltransferase n=1 Tax=Rhizobium metallidurans TaxID=1265931 RepID=A0A7W6GCX1_9HYPH|nr:GNAT family N-acetyltransferase [Rhizobium metallidurans]MBB3967268.1 RimJ/RimL family protein N-acetyltransferase [Rhizobium metallidurans]